MIGKILILGLVVSQAKPDRSIGSLTQRNCPPSGHLLLPHENDNTKFYFCEWGSRKEPPRTCAAGTVFSFRLQSCDWPWNKENENDSDEGDHEDGAADHGVKKGIDADAVEENNQDNNNNDGREIDDLDNVAADNDKNLSNGCPKDFTVHRLLAHNYNCSKYYYCVAGKTILKHCSPGLYFNPDISVCDWPKNVNCERSGGGDSETNDSKVEDLECKENDNNEINDDEGDSNDGDEGENLANGCPANYSIYRLLPHESDCSKFYYCVFGETVLKKCPSGLYFNPNGSICDWPWNVDCTTGDTNDEENDDESENDNDEDNGNPEGDDGGSDAGENEDSDNSEGGDDEAGNENEVDDENVGDRRVKKKKLEVVAEVIVRLRKRH